MRKFLITTAVILTVCFAAARASAASIQILNPSFEQNTNEVWPGYCTISNWVTYAGAPGVDNSFTWADNGIKPDRQNVAFIQGVGGIQQNISGLDTSKIYWLQVWFNVRSMATNISNVEIYYPSYAVGNELMTGVYESVEAAGLHTVPFHFTNIVFQPLTNSGDLLLANLAYPGVGDVSVLYDSIVLIQKDSGEVVIKNPSFEASGDKMYPLGVGYISNVGGNVAGWNHIGECNLAMGWFGSPFNGGTTIPEGDLALVIQSSTTGGVSQTINDLVNGSMYELSYNYNTRPGFFTNGLRVTLGGTVVQNEAGIFNQPTYYSTNFQFNATATSMDLSFECLAMGDSGAMIDNVSIKYIIPEPAILGFLTILGMAFLRRK